MFRRKVKLPTTIQEFDDLAALVVKRYNLVDAHHAAAVLSVAIRHLPPEQAYARLDYLGHYILKNIANHVANRKCQVLQHEAQIDQLASLVEADPANSQARDALVKAASEGSKYAASMLDKFGFDQPQVIPANPN